MSTLRRIARPVDASLRTITGRYSRWLEDLLHTIKSELVGRFNSVDARLNQVEESAESSHTSLADQLAMQGAAIRTLTQLAEQSQAETAIAEAKLNATIDELRETGEQIDIARTEILERIATIVPSIRLRELMGARLTDIDESASGFLNYANSHIGPLADVGLWINHPVTIEWRQGQAAVGSVNERILEQPFVFAALADLTPGSRILDVGGGESTVAVALASSGYNVTVIEPMGYPFSHPNLSVFEKPLEQFDTVEPFDAVVALSSIEHFGIAHYDIGCERDLDADTNAIASIANLLAPNGRLVLTTPFGPPDVTEVERIYDDHQLRRLLDGWTIHHTSIGNRADDRTWELEGTELTEPAGPGRVAMLVATPPETA